MKCFAVKLKQETNIEGVKYPASGDENPIAILTTDVNPITLLGLIQYHHAELVEVADLPDESGDESDESGESDQAESGEAAETDSESSDETTSSPHVAETVTSPPVGATQPVAGGKVQPGDGSDFIAAGLDQKTAEALMKNGIGTVEDLSALLADPEFDLSDLDEIGPVRVEKIKATFLVDQK